MTFIPEYDEPEMVEPEPHDHPQTVEEPERDPGGHRHPLGRSVALEAIVRGLSEVPPCPVCGRTVPCRCLPPQGYSRVEAQGRLVEAALLAVGLLVEERIEPRPFDPEEVAEFLADRSGFARYTQVEEGWRRLMESEQDVEVAASYAMRRVSSGEVDMVKAAKAALLEWHQRRVGSPSAT